MAESPISSAAVDGLWKFIFPLQGEQGPKMQVKQSASRRCITARNTLLSLVFHLFSSVVSSLRSGLDTMQRMPQWHIMTTGHTPSTAVPAEDGRAQSVLQ